MYKKSKKSHSFTTAYFTPYEGPAGGWGALRSTTKHWLQSENATRNLFTLLKTNQAQGFDCPGCAWGEKHDNSKIRFCENGAKAVNWEATSKTVSPDFFAKYSVSWLKQQTDYYLEFQGRLTHPMSYNAETDHYEPISWDAAFAKIAEALSRLSSPNQLELYTSGRASNEAAFLYQLFGRMWGTNNFPDCSNMCHEASGYALTSSIGTGKGTVELEDFEHADAVFVFGQNPGTNHPRMLEALREVSKRGAAVVSFNTLRERGLERFQHPQNPVEMLTNGSSPISSYYYCPKIGGDMAVVRGIVKALLKMEEEAISEGRSIFDNAFLQQHTFGLTKYLTMVDATSWESIVEQSGLSQAEITQVATLYADSPRVICTWAMGITQHKHSVATIHEIINLLALRGNIGKKGAGACPVRGHSNVQGDRTMGINERPSKAFLQRLGTAIGFNPPYEAGHAVIDAIRAMKEGKSKVFIGLGGNFASAAPDTQVTISALESCDLTVQISTKLNRSHLAVGKQALILPCLGRTDIDYQKEGKQQVTVEDSFSMVHASAGVLEPLSKQMRSEPAIIAGIAEAVFANKPQAELINWRYLIEDYGRIRTLIEVAIPGFEQFNEKIKCDGGFYLGNHARDLQWDTEKGKVIIHDHALPKSILLDKAASQLTDRSLIMQTLRSHDQYNTTIYGMNDRYRGVTGERKVVFINEADLQRLGFASGQLVTIRSLWDDKDVREVHAFKVIPYDIPAGNIAAYYPETNPLVPLDSVGDFSSTPTSKSIAVELVAYQAANSIV